MASAAQAGARGPLAAALLAFAAGLPSLGLPFLSDDWMHAIFAREGTILVTPFAYFRPLTSIGYWIDWRVWGTWAPGYRLHGLLLAALAAALVVVLVRRYTADSRLAAATGVAFALHPYHAGAVAWIAARSDLLSTVLVLLAAWSFDRWSERRRAIPWLALLLYAAALGAKEGAVVLPGLLLVATLAARGKRFSPGDWARALLPFAAIALAHFLLLRPAVLGSTGLGPLKWLDAGPVNLLLYGVASVLPLPPEVFQSRFVPTGLVAAALVALLLAAGRARTGRWPLALLPAGAAFVVLLGPSLIGFVQRYYFLPSAAAALALVVLLRAAPRRLAITAGLLLALVWTGTAMSGWIAWYDGGRATRAYVGALVEAARDPAVETIVVVGAPHRVHGVPVTAAFDHVVPLMGGREVEVLTAGEFDYPTTTSDAAPRVTSTEDHVTVLLGVEPAPYSRYVWEGYKLDRDPDGHGVTVASLDEHRVRVSVMRREGRRVYVWRAGGALEPV